MVRVEQNKLEDKEALKREIKQQVEVDIRRSATKKKILRCCSCFVIFIVFICAFVFAGAWAVAKTGLYNVPYISDWAFEAPEPMHEVIVPESYEGASLFEDLKTKFESMTWPGEQTQGQISIEEEMLNVALLEHLVEPAHDMNFDVKRAQIAVEPEGMEVYLHLERGEKMSVYLSILAMPKLDGNNIGFDILSVRLGNFNVPTFVADPIIRSFLGAALDVLELPVVGFIHLKEIKLIYGEIILIGE